MVISTEALADRYRSWIRLTQALTGLPVSGSVGRSLPIPHSDRSKERPSSSTTEARQPDTGIVMISATTNGHHLMLFSFLLFLFNHLTVGGWDRTSSL